jgi:hypothetical protein
MSTFSISLRAFRQPIILISIMVLLINDHILKIVMPSWITGKLSDFAGLFFFPFLLAAVLAFPLEALGGKPRPIFGLACIFTGLWFSLMKTVLPINALTETFASWLVNAQAQIVMDVTDLIALPMIWLAWMLWVKLEQKSSNREMGRLPYLALGVAAFAAIASSPCPTEPYVNRVVSWKDRLYISYQGVPQREAETGAVVLRSLDNAQSWQEIANPEPELTKLLSGEVQHEACSSVNEQICYRISGREDIEESRDGGFTWAISWRPWQDRLDFQQRIVSKPLSCGPTLWNVPLDLTVLDNRMGRVVVVSMKNNGILVKEFDGPWVPYPVRKAQPVPATLSSFQSAADFVWPETFLFSTLALLELISFLALTRIVVSRQLRTSASGIDRFLTWLSAALPVIGLAMVGMDQLSTTSAFGFGRAMGFASLLSIADFYPACLPIIGLLSLIVLVLWYQQGVIKTRARSIGLLLVGLFIAVLTSLIPTYIFIQWALGSIERYPTAWLWAWVSAAVLFVTGSIFIAYLTRRNFLATN